MTQVEQLAAMLQKRAAIYVRVSGRTQAERGTSLITQEENCRNHIIEQNYIVDDEYIFSEVHTAREYYERPELARLLEASKRGEFDVVIVYAYDRLARKQMHQAVIIDKLQRYGVQIESVTEAQVDETPVGQFLRNTLGFVAELENEKRIDRTQQGIQQRIKDGELMGSARPLYGYKWADPTPGMKTRYVINPEEATVIQRAFAMSKSGMTLLAIAQQFTLENIPTANGKKRWLGETISRILTNRFYKGKATARQYKVTREAGKRKVRRRDIDEQIPLPDGLVPAIIDEDTFEAVQVQMRYNKEHASRNKIHDYNALLNYGLAICGYCGGHMNVRYVNEHKIFYRCTRSTHYHEDCQGVMISVKTLDEIVWHHVVTIIKNPSLVAQKLEALKQENPVSEELTYINERLPQIEEELENLVDMGQKAKSKAVRERIEVNIAQLEDEQNKLFIRQDALLQVEINYEEERKKLADFVRWCANAEKELPNATFADKLRACENFRIKVLVWRRDAITNQPVFEIKDEPLAVVSQTSSSSLAGLSR